MFQVVSLSYKAIIVLKHIYVNENVTFFNIASQAIKPNKLLLRFNANGRVFLPIPTHCKLYEIGLAATLSLSVHHKLLPIGS